MIEIENTPYCYEESRHAYFELLSNRVRDMRSTGRLSPEVLGRIRRFFRIKSIYHSNAIEGNLLEVGETRQVVEHGLTITGKPLKDQAEALNLSHALDFLEELAGASERPIGEADIRQIHALVLQGLDEDAGAYRKVPVEISGSGFAPPGPESVPVQMQEFADWCSAASMPEEADFASIRGLLAAAVAHTWFVTVHPFIDGNGRVARLLMNLLLMRYGFPVAIVSREDRLRYYDALETSQSSDLTPVCVLLAECIEESLEEYERAVQEQREQTEWAESLAQRIDRTGTIRLRNEYEVWRNAMELLKSYFRRSVDDLDSATGTMRFYLKDFGNLEFEKYASLRTGGSAKRTWFLRVDFRGADRAARYLFFFGSSSRNLRDLCDVTLHIAREEPENSYNYKRLDELPPRNTPDPVEIGYRIAKERFVIRTKNGRAEEDRIEEIGRRFFDDVMKLHFQA